METTVPIQDDIYKQLSAGFSKQEIAQNLQSKGFSESAIDDAFRHIDFSEAAADNGERSVSTKSILLGLLFVVVVLFRFGRFINSGSIFVGLGVLTGIGMVYYFFTKKS